MHVTAALFVGIKPAKAAALRKIDNLWQGAESLNDAQFAALMQRPGAVLRNIQLPK